MPLAMSVTVPMRPIGMRVSACWRAGSRSFGAEVAGPHRQHLVAHVGLDRTRVHRVDQCKVDYTPSVPRPLFSRWPLMEDPCASSSRRAQSPDGQTATGRDLPRNGLRLDACCSSQHGDRTVAAGLRRFFSLFFCRSRRSLQHTRRASKIF